MEHLVEGHTYSNQNGPRLGQPMLCNKRNEAHLFCCQYFKKYVEGNMYIYLLFTHIYTIDVYTTHVYIYIYTYMCVYLVNNKAWLIVKPSL